ncbi:MAG: PAS domain S-box protein [Thermoleophilaceae bacterium]
MPRLARRPVRARNGGTRTAEVKNPHEELLQGLDAIVWEADPETLQFSFVSERAEQILGYPVRDWLAQPNFWVDHIHPDDRELTLAACREATARCEDHKLEYRAVAADGRVVWLCDIIKVACGADGRPSTVRGVMIDVTGQREAEQALRVSEERYRTLVETAADVILSFDGDGHLTFANSAVREVLGLEPAEMLGRHFVELIAPEGITEAVKQFRELTRGNRATGRAVRMLAQGGRTVIVRFNASPLRDAEDRIVGVTCTGLDVTEARGRERELREARELFESAFVDAPIGMALVSADPEDFGRFLRVNRALCEFTGYPPDELLKIDLQTITHPNDQAGGPSALDPRKHAEDRVEVEQRYLRKDGKGVWGLLHAAVIRNPAGDPLYVAAQIKDINESKEAQEKLEQSRTQLQQIVDGTTSSIHVKDLEGRYLLVNSRLEQILGRPREELLGKSDAEVLAPEGARRSRAHDLAALRARGPVEREGLMPCAGGSRTFLTVKFPLFGPEGEPYAVCGVATDLSERKRAEEEIARLAAERARLIARSLESEERERRRISEALHDEVVQTLLAVRQDLIEVAKGRSDLLDRAATGIDRTLEQLRATIRELHPVALAHADLPAALRTVTREIERLGRVELELELDEEAAGGPDQLLLSAARELVLNVVKHSESERARVALRRSNGEVVLEVADEGVGIPDGRLQAAAREGHIGLAALQERVSDAGGRFQVASKAGEGTRVNVSLPASSRTA